MSRSPLARSLALTALLTLGAAPACDDADPATSTPNADVTSDTGAPDTTLAPDTGAADTAPADTAAPPDTSAPDTVAADTTPLEEVVDTNPGDDDTTSEETELVGRWAQKQVQSSLTEVPFVGETVATTSTLLLLDITADGSGYTITQTVCAIDLDSGTELVTTVLPDAAVAGIRPATRGATLGAGGAVAIAGLSEVWGATLTNPETDALPTSPTDARVVDHEPDGKPGMTVRVAGLIDGEIYVVQRGFTSLEGTYDGLSRIDGLVTWRQEQSILDADNPLLKTPLATRTNPDASASWFRTTRLDAGATCATVVASEAALFAR